jgi:DNA mismatch repair protein PMS2
MIAPVSAASITPELYNEEQPTYSGTPPIPISQPHQTQPELLRTQYQPPQSILGAVSQASMVRLASSTNPAPAAYDVPTTLNWTLDQLRLSFIKADLTLVQIPESMNIFSTECLQSDNFESFFNKDQFPRMQVLGQFNLGFIVVNLQDTPELFLVDQHAADEISQFEMLCETTKLHMQPLVLPILLHLQPHEEILVSQHLSLFERFGYKLHCDLDRPSGERLSVRALAFTKSKLFDVEGVYEAVGQLVQHSYVESEDALVNLCRPSEFRSVMASRACRSAVMIGTELPHPHMTKIVHHLKELKRPWNCPHGRPTMLHLSSLLKLQSTKEAARLGNLLN